MIQKGITKPHWQSSFSGSSQIIVGSEKEGSKLEFSELKLDESEVISRKSEVIHGKSFSSKKAAIPLNLGKEHGLE